MTVDPITQARDALAAAETHLEDCLAQCGELVTAKDALRVLIEHAEKAEAERDAAQAVIAQALDAAGHGQPTIYRVARILQSVPLDALQAERARVWDEGRKAWAKYELACEDASAAGQGHLVRTPANPYITHTEGAREGDRRTLGGGGSMTLEQAQAALIMIRDHAHAVLAVSDRGVSTHYEGCWVHHRDCLAAWVADIAETALDEMGVPR